MTLIAPVAPIKLVRHFLSAAEVSALWDEVATYAFERMEVTVFGKTHFIPRQQVWIGDEGCDYQYSKRLIAPQPWPEKLGQLKNKLNDTFGGNCNSVLVNHYRDGRDCMGWHSDNEPEIVSSSSIISVSIGASRDFVLRHKQTKQKVTLLLEQGDVLLMAPQLQTDWQHAVPKRLKVTSARVNFTFRHVKPDFHQFR